MSISVGDTLPEASFTTMGNEGPNEIKGTDLFKGRKVVLFAVPGAFTPTCHNNHLPGFIENADAIKAKGVDEIAVVSVNDVFVMDAWKSAVNCDDKISFLADGSGDFTKAIGMELDLTERGLGPRSLRYAMIVDDGKVTSMSVDDVPSNATASSAENILKEL
jgi:peroxiredoxin